jgi:hypothetical protein
MGDPTEPVAWCASRPAHGTLDWEKIRIGRTGYFDRPLYGAPPSPTLPSREAIARAICVGNPDDCVMGTAGTNHPMVCHQRAWERHLGQADRILALFTAPQPLAKPMPLDTD